MKVPTNPYTPPDSFDWLEMLEELDNGKSIYEYEKSNLEAMAGMWPTCACGQLCKVLPRTGIGAPVDQLLGQLGINFFQLVKAENWHAALFTFKKIEARTAKLLKEMQQEEDKKKLTCAGTSVDRLTTWPNHGLSERSHVAPTHVGVRETN